MGSILKLSGAYFVLLGILTIPFSLHLLSFHTDFIRWIFGDLAFYFAQKMGFKPILNDLSSDSIGLYLLLGFLLFISLILGLFTQNRISQRKREHLFNLSITIAAFYLSLILFKYGLDKLFKVQFNQPEPNLLYTPLGLLDKDILFWSTMGTSRAYNLFMGCMEILPAVLLLFQRTRIIGAIIATGVLLNVVAINFSFDISVKLFSSFLLFLALFISWRGIKQIFDLFILKRDVKPVTSATNLTTNKNYKLIKSLMVLFVLAEAFYPHLKSGNFNDDNAPRPLLHGAYEVIKDANTNNETAIKRVFIHRDGYLIFQDENDQMTDFKAVFNTALRKIIVTNYESQTKEIAYKWYPYNHTLSLEIHPGEAAVQFQKLDHRSMPLLLESFHLTVDKTTSGHIF
jgi:hypothetical protein